MTRFSILLRSALKVDKVEMQVSYFQPYMLCFQQPILFDSFTDKFSPNSWPGNKDLYLLLNSLKWQISLTAIINNE